VEEFIRFGTPTFRRANLAMFAAGVATFGLLYCVQPLMPEFSRYYGVDAATSSLCLSLTSSLLAIAMLFAGVVSDAWGRRTIMSVSLVASACLVFLSAIAPGWASLLVLRSLLGLSLSGVPAVAMAYLSEEMHPDSIGLAMGLYIGGSAVGGMGGRLLVGIISDHFGWRIALGAMSVIGLIAALLFYRSLPPSRHFSAHPVRLGDLTGRYRALFDDRGLRWLFAEGFLLLGAFVTVYNYIGYRLTAAPYGLSQTSVGLIFSVYLVGTISSTWVGHLAGRLGRRKVLWAMYALMLAGVALTVLAPLWIIVAGIVVITFGFFGGHSIVSSWVGRRASAGKGHAASMYLFFYYLGSGVAGSLGGLFYSARGWIGVAAFVGALWTLGLLIAWRLFYLEPLRGPPSNPPPA
jgi:YNFM family putative membrane transporter